MCAFLQHSESANREDPFLLDGTSIEGLAVKKSAGRIISWNISTGLIVKSVIVMKMKGEGQTYMTGQSSTRGL